MFLVVLCSFSTSVVKQNLKLLSPSTYRKWWITAPEYATAFPANKSCRSDFGKTLTKAITSCFGAAIVVTFCQEIFSAQCEFVTSKTKASRIGYFTICPQPTTSLVKGLLRSTLGQRQRLTSSTIAGNFALRMQRTPLSN